MEMRRPCNEPLPGTGIADPCTGPIGHSMSDHRHHVRRVSVAQRTTYLLFACLALEAGTIVSRLSERALIVPAVADAQPLPADIAASDARWRADAEQRADARSRAIGTLNLVAFACTAVLWLGGLPPAPTQLPVLGAQPGGLRPPPARAERVRPLLNTGRALPGQ